MLNTNLDKYLEYFTGRIKCFVTSFCHKTIFPPSRVIKPEEGKKLADSWGAAFMESSAKENEVMNTRFRSLCSPHF